MILTANSAQSLAAALKAAKAGDTILLDAGDYSKVQIKGIVFDGTVTIASKDPSNPATLTGLTITNSEGLKFQDLHLDFSSPWTVWNAQIVGSRLRTHSQKSTVAARAMADRKTVGHRS